MNLFQDLSFDEELCQQICLTLAHSLWQIALLAYMANEFVGISCRRDTQWGYGVFVWTLVLSLLALPATFSVLSVTSPDLTSPVIEITEAPAAVPLELPQIEGAITPSEPEVETIPIPQRLNIGATPAESHHVESYPFKDWAPKVFTLYILGVVVMLVRLSWAFLGSQYLARHGEPITVGPVVEAMNRLIHAWEMRVRPVVAHAHDIVIPQVVGLLKPTILLPTSALTGLTPSELEMILAHELAHVRRLDMWVNLLQRLSEALLFFNPALWYLSRQISTYREYCCDEQTCGDADESSSNRVQYAQALLRVVELSDKRTQHGQLTALAATGSRPSELRRRVARLFGEPLREPVGISRSVLVMLFTGVVVVFAIPVSWQNAAETVPESEQAEVVEKAPGVPAELKFEVVAIGTHDEKPQRWWDKEGQPLSDLSFEWYDTDRKLPEGTTWRRVVIRVDGLPGNHEQGDVNLNIPSARYYWGAYVKPTDAADTGKYYARYFQWDGREDFDLKIGLAKGEWQTIAQGTMVSGPRTESIVFSDPMMTDDGLTLFVSHNVTDRPYQIVAVDRSGKNHRSTRGGGKSINTIVQSQGQFPDLDEDDVDHFEFQVRNYEWREIEDLPTNIRKSVAFDQSEAKDEMLVKVVDIDGQPLAGVKVFRNLSFIDGETNRHKIKNETYYTDESGEAVVALENATTDLNIWAQKQSHVPLVTSWRDVATEGNEPIPASFEFRMTRGTKIGGIVTDVAGIPIAGAKVEVEDVSLYAYETEPPTDSPKVTKRPGRSNWLAYGSAGVLTDAEGKWSLDNVPIDDELLANKEKWTEGQTPLRLRFSHPDYETIDGMEGWEKVGNPSLESLRDASARTVMKWVDGDDPGRVNAIRLEQGQQFKNAQFKGRHFKGQELMVWSDSMLAGANLVGSTWEDMMVPGVSKLLDEANLTDAKLIDVQLIGQSGGMQEANFTRAKIENSDLNGGGAGLQKAVFADATITNSSLRGGGSSFQGSSFEGAKLHSSQLSGNGPAFQQANFDRASLYRTTIACDDPTAFQLAKLNDTEFVECDLSSIDAEALRSCEFDTATPPRYDAKTKLPEGFAPKAAGWKLIE